MYQNLNKSKHKTVLYEKENLIMILRIAEMLMNFFLH